MNFKTNSFESIENEEKISSGLRGGLDFRDAVEYKHASPFFETPKH